MEMIARSPDAGEAPGQSAATPSPTSYAGLMQVFQTVLQHDITEPAAQDVLKAFGRQFKDRTEAILYILMQLSNISKGSDNYIDEMCMLAYTIDDEHSKYTRRTAPQWYAMMEVVRDEFRDWHTQALCRKLSSWLVQTAQRRGPVKDLYREYVELESGWECMGLYGNLGNATRHILITGKKQLERDGTFNKRPVFQSALLEIRTGKHVPPKIVRMTPRQVKREIRYLDGLLEILTRVTSSTFSQEITDLMASIVKYLHMGNPGQIQLATLRQELLSLEGYGRPLRNTVWLMNRIRRAGKYMLTEATITVKTWLTASLAKHIAQISRCDKTYESSRSLIELFMEKYMLVWQMPPPFEDLRQQCDVLSTHIAGQHRIGEDILRALAQIGKSKRTGGFSSADYMHFRAVYNFNFDMQPYPSNFHTPSFSPIVKPNTRYQEYYQMVEMGQIMAPYYMSQMQEMMAQLHTVSKMAMLIDTISGKPNHKS